MENVWPASLSNGEGEEMKTLNDEQLTALKAYAEKKGKKWKDELLYDWSRGADIGPELRQIRNTFGPSWLGKFKFDE